jgi:uncharacterized protein
MRRRLAPLLLAWVLLALPGSAWAQQPKPYLEKKDTYNVFVLGDSLAGGLGAGMTRLTDDDERIVMDGRFKEDSGLARPEFYDWNEALPKILESNEIDIAVILIGTNDVREMREGESRLMFGSPEWITRYGAQVDRLVESVQRAGAAVYWISPPPMAAIEFDQAIAQIAAIQKFRVESKGGKYVDLRPALINPDGSLMVSGPDHLGDVRRLRDRDGVHFMKAGNNRLAQLVLDVIYSDIAAADAASLLVEQPAPDVNVITAQGPPDMRGTAIAPEGPGGRPGPASAAVDTPAKRLFEAGEWPAPVAGRFDDFTFQE